MATVKGDVHDIGKNIVGVVLQCNNYEVIDLGVMVPAEKILDAARDEKADIIGLSGLITPSLDEMCHVAAEMERQASRAAVDRRRHDQPGAHRGQDPSELPARPGRLCERREPRGRRGRLAAVAQNRAAPSAEIRAEYARIAARTPAPKSAKQRAAAGRRPHKRLAARLVRQLRAADPAARHASSAISASANWSPTSIGRRSRRLGTRRQISGDPQRSDRRRGGARLFEDAQAMLRRIAAETWFRARAVSASGRPTAKATNSGHTATKRAARRSPAAYAAPAAGAREGRANVALADFVAPRASGLTDYIGAFAVTAGIGEQDIADRFKARTTITPPSWSRRSPTVSPRRWPSACTDASATSSGPMHPTRSCGAELIAEKYRGIRPAPGYPAQPDHTEKATLFRLLDGEARPACRLTESFAMWPGGSVCGLYFGHPESHYFGVGKIERDQVEDYAERKGRTLAQTEKWLAPILNYDPQAAARRTAE